jgi:hypothetical protein
MKKKYVVQKSIEDEKAWKVVRDEGCWIMVAKYYRYHPNPKSAAFEHCARLNREAERKRK